MKKKFYLKNKIFFDKHDIFFMNNNNYQEDNKKSNYIKINAIIITTYYMLFHIGCQSTIFGVIMRNHTNI